jgi:hypothetical protein
MTHVLEIVHGTEDNGLEGDQDETFRQQKRNCVCLRMYCMKHTSFCFVLFLLSIAQLAHGGLLCVNCSLTLDK